MMILNIMEAHEPTG